MGVCGPGEVVAGIVVLLFVNNFFVNFPQESIEHLYKQYSRCFRFLSMIDYDP